jgi:hypothetical protein
LGWQVVTEIVNHTKKGEKKFFSFSPFQLAVAEWLSMIQRKWKQSGGGGGRERRLKGFKLLLTFVWIQIVSFLAFEIVFK